MSQEKTIAITRSKDDSEEETLDAKRKSESKLAQVLCTFFEECFLNAPPGDTKVA